MRNLLFLEVKPILRTVLLHKLMNILYCLIIKGQPNEWVVKKWQLHTDSKPIYFILFVAQWSQFSREWHGLTARATQVEAQIHAVRVFEFRMQEVAFLYRVKDISNKHNVLLIIKLLYQKNKL